MKCEVVKFDTRKGYGFVKMPDGEQAFLHMRCVRAAGINILRKGDILEVDVATRRLGPKNLRGYYVHAVYEKLSPDVIVIRPERVKCVIESYSKDRGFGHAVLADDNAPDRRKIFIHKSVLARAGIEGLSKGDFVRISVVESPDGPEAADIELWKEMREYWDKMDAAE